MTDDPRVFITGDGNIVGDHNKVSVTYQAEPVTIPAPDAVAAHRRALRARIQARSRRWGGVTAYMHEEGVTLPVEASPYETGRLGAREGLLPALLAARRLLVLGGPGSGKSVSLQRLAWELCDDAGASVPVLIQLFRYAGGSLGAWVKAALHETGELRLDSARALAALLKEEAHRFVFLLDGLNEVQPAYRDALVGEVVRWMQTYPEHPVILTSRPQDELWRRLREEVDRALMVQPVADEQARRYLVHHLAERGAELYEQLDARLREMARTPLILWLIKEAGAAAESIPGNRGELYRRFVARMLRRDTQRRLDAAIPEAEKLQALGALAYHLSLDERLTCARAEAESVVAGVLEDAGRAREVIEACARHGLLVGDETLWFAPHQTVQEYFAAQVLCERRQREAQQTSLPRWWRRLRGRGVMHLARNDWWAEPFVQMAGLVEDADALARDLARENPWLAWWCVEEGREVNDETRAVVAERSTWALQSGGARDRRRAVAALARMQNARSVPQLIRAAGDEDSEVAQSAVRALGALGQAVKPQIATAFRDRALWRGVVRYVMAYPDPELYHRLPPRALETLLGFPVVRVPAGPFLMGSDPARDRWAEDDELPQHEVTLPDYWIAATPVTVAQFREFALAYRWADPKSLRGASDHPMVSVSFRDALAYCRWLRTATGLLVTVPGEAAWEKAARGTDGRIYPWGDELPTGDRCNAAGRAGRTTPVGAYSPAGDSPYGCVDMAGNVWEWTRSSPQPYPYDPADGREDVILSGDQVLRGGAFDDPQDRVRAAARRVAPSINRAYNVGFRVVIAPFRRTT
jgi:formylglycine-generating enzyme required for sulfatase activity